MAVKSRQNYQATVYNLIITYIHSNAQMLIVKAPKHTGHR